MLAPTPAWTWVGFGVSLSLWCQAGPPPTGNLQVPCTPTPASCVQCIPEGLGWEMLDLEQLVSKTLDLLGAPPQIRLKKAGALRQL